MADVFGDPNTLAIAVAVVGGGGVLGFVTTLLKWKPERTNVLVDAAQGAVIVQSGVIESLNQRLAALEEEVHELTESLQAAVQDRDRLRAENVVLRDERDQLRERIKLWPKPA